MQRIIGVFSFVLLALTLLPQSSVAAVDDSCADIPRWHTYYVNQSLGGFHEELERLVWLDDRFQNCPIAHVEFTARGEFETSAVQLLNGYMPIGFREYLVTGQRETFRV